MLGIYRMAAQVVASQAVLSSTELVSRTVSQSVSQLANPFDRTRPWGLLSLINTRIIEIIFLGSNISTNAQGCQPYRHLCVDYLDNVG
jgi:hypothetical protein